MNDAKSFHRGKEARRLGKPRVLVDARFSVASRQQFYAGWDEQDRFMQAPPSDAQREESERVRLMLRGFARGMRETI